MKTRHWTPKIIGIDKKNLFFKQGHLLYSILILNDNETYAKGTLKSISDSRATFGRDQSCTVPFDQGDDTVSREHAYIIFENGTFTLTHLSGSNATLINGKPVYGVGQSIMVRAGDEIQLSLEGPKFQIKYDQVRQFGVTRRVEALMRSALFPYKIGIAAALICLVSGGFMFYYQYLKYEPILNITQTFEATHQADTQKIIDLNRQNEDLQKIIKKVYAFNIDKVNAGLKTYSLPEEDISGLIKNINGSVYLIKAKAIEVIYPDGTGEYIELKANQCWRGTGFVSNDGRFITARHVIEPWMFFGKNDADMIRLNLTRTQGGSVKAYFEARSSNESFLQFTSDDFKVNKDTDYNALATIATGESIALVKATVQDDWAFMQAVSYPNSIVLSPQLAERLTQTKTLHLLGFSNGETFQDKQRLVPLYSTTTVAQDGVKNGFINVSNFNVDVGNSGGPALVLKDGRFQAIGIVVSKIGEVGRIVPISRMR